MARSEKSTSLAVIGAGPGGYWAAFRAADMGMRVTLIDPEPYPGGVCLYRGCVPAKALTHVAKFLTETERASEWGICFNNVETNLVRLNQWKKSVTEGIGKRLRRICDQRQIDYVRGWASFENEHTLSLAVHGGHTRSLSFDYAIVATGSVPNTIPNVARSPRVMYSRQALEIDTVPERLLVVGAGYVGLELGQVYAVLGSRVSVMEMMPTLLPYADEDLVKLLARRLEEQFEAILVKTRLVEVREDGQRLVVCFEGEGGDQVTQEFDRVLISVGRKPNTASISLENTAAEADEEGFIRVDSQQRTAAPCIFAVGDVAGHPMLAHKAMHDARIAVDAIAGKKIEAERAAIPMAVFSHPEIAWCGLTEKDAREQGRDVKIARFPWKASARAATIGHPNGITKLIVEPGSEKILGVGMSGPDACEVVAQGVLAIEMNARAGDLALAVQPHPTLSETVKEAAQAVFGYSTHF